MWTLQAAESEFLFSYRYVLVVIYNDDDKSVEFAKAIQIFFIRGEQRILLSQRSLSPFRGLGGFAVSAPLREMLWNYEVGPDLNLMLF